MLPNFFIVGAMKAGTTWLSFNLENHPQVFMPKEELHFFNRPPDSPKDLRWYEDQFAQAVNATAIGEKTAGYLLDPSVPGELQTLFPQAKIIIVLRNPVERAISQINHHIRYDWVNPSLDSDRLLASKDFKAIDEKFAILERGRYLSQIQRYYQHFPAEQVLILVNEIDIRQTPTATLERVSEFLGIDPTFEFTLKNQRIHKNRNSKLGIQLAYRLPWARPIVSKVDRYIPSPKSTPFRPSHHQVEQLYDLYERDNRQLFEFLGQDLPEAWTYQLEKVAR